MTYSPSDEVPRLTSVGLLCKLFSILKIELIDVLDCEDVNGNKSESKILHSDFVHVPFEFGKCVRNVRILVLGEVLCDEIWYGLREALNVNFPSCRSVCSHLYDGGRFPAGERCQCSTTIPHAPGVHTRERKLWDNLACRLGISRDCQHNHRSISLVSRPSSFSGIFHLCLNV